MKSANGNPAELEISMIGDRLEFRIYADQRVTVLQEDDPTEVKQILHDLDEATERLTTGCHGYWQFPRRRR